MLTEIKDSTIPNAGKGLFAVVDIPVNTKLADFIGVEMTLKDFKTQYGTDYLNTYSMRRQHKIINGKQYDNLSKYCNESSSPTVILKQKALYTLRDIHAGEELFLSYPKQYNRNYVL